MIKIIVDSASDFTIDEAEKLGIYVIPIEINIEGKIYQDGIDLKKDEFFNMLKHCQNLPKTSQINEYRYQEIFSKFIDDYDNLLVITLSSKLSGTYFEAKKASSFSDKIYVLDSSTASIGERFLCEYALKLIKEGKTFKEIINILETKKKKIYIVALLNDLENLKKGGRISPLIAFAGEMFKVKPLILVNNGKIKLASKALGHKKGFFVLNQLINKMGGIDYSLPYAFLYSGCDKTLLIRFLNDSKEIYKKEIDDINKIPTYLIGATIGTHIGSDAIGVCFFAK